MSNHLLPANATALEITLSEAIDIAHLEAGAEAIRRFKAEPPDSALPSLVWEYALEELLPYLPEPRLAIREGVLWQRLRGTPRSLAVALSWIGAEAVFVEQEAPGGAHWAEFQIDPGRWLEWEEIGRFIAVARLSAPARSRLARIYHGHDRRRLILGQSALDEALLSDYSGTFWRDGATRVSFGRRHDAGQTLWALAASGLLRDAAHGRFARYADRCLLDEMALGCRPAPNPRIEHARAHERAQALGLLGRAQQRPERTYCKAQVALSEQWPLGETNACLPARAWQAADAPMRLGDAISEGIGAGRWVEITERLERSVQAALAMPQVILGRSEKRLVSQAARADRHLRLSDMALSDELPSGWQLSRQAHRAAGAGWMWPGGWALGAGRWHGLAHPLGTLGEAASGVEVIRPRSASISLPAISEARAGCHARSAHWRGQRWAGRWQAKSWRQARECLQSQHTTTTE